MADIRLSDDEIGVLRMVLAAIAIKSRTGELGVLHGLSRFVSTHSTLTKKQRQELDALAQKLGLVGGVRSFDG